MLFLRLSRCCCFLKATTTRWYPSKTLSLVSKKCAVEKRWLCRWCRWNATGPCSGRAVRRSQRKCVDKKRTLANTESAQKMLRRVSKIFQRAPARALVSFTNEVSRLFSARVACGYLYSLVFVLHRSMASSRCFCVSIIYVVSSLISNTPVTGR